MLDASDGTGSIVTTDVVAHGSIYSYVVEALGPSGQMALSNPATVDAHSAGCPPPEPPPLLGAAPVELITPTDVVDVYCYVSTTGDQWQRFPAVGFFDLGPDGAVDASGLGDLITQVQDEDEALVTYGSWDCWGWEGSQLVALGLFEAEGEPEPGSALTLTDGLGVAELVVEYSPFAPGEIDLGVATGLDLDLLSAVFDPTATDPSMLAPTVGYSIQTTDCANNLPGTVKPDFVVALCHPGHPTDDPDDHPHPYLVWDLDDPDNCVVPGSCVHPGSESYFPYSVVDSGFHVYDLHASDTVPLATLHGFDQGMFIVPLQGPCGVQRAFEVRSFVKIDQPMTYESQAPGAVTLFYEPCLAETPVELDFRFTQLELGDVDDGLFDDDVEIYGDIGVVPTVGTSRYLYFANPADVDDFNCRSDETIAPVPTDLSTSALWKCPKQTTAGVYELDRFPWFKCVDGSSAFVTLFCFSLSWTLEDTVQIETTQGNDSVAVEVRLFDRDHASPDDPVCHGTVIVTKEPAQDWSQVAKDWSFYQGDNGSASCRLWWTVSVAG